MVLDDTTSINFGSQGDIHLATGGAVIRIQKENRSGAFLKYLNAFFKPMRQLDRALTEERFYWIFGETDW